MPCFEIHTGYTHKNKPTSSIRDHNLVSNCFQPTAALLTPVVDTFPVQNISVATLAPQVRPIQIIVVHELQAAFPAAEEQMFAAIHHHWPLYIKPEQIVVVFFRKCVWGVLGGGNDEQPLRRSVERNCNTQMYLINDLRYSQVSCLWYEVFYVLLS